MFIYLFCMLLCCWSSNDVVDQLMMNKLERPHFIPWLNISVLILRIIMLITLIIIQQPVMAARNDTILEGLISRTYLAFSSIENEKFWVMFRRYNNVLYQLYLLQSLYIHMNTCLSEFLQSIKTQNTPSENVAKCSINTIVHIWCAYFVITNSSLILFRSI